MRHYRKLYLLRSHNKFFLDNEDRRTHSPRVLDYVYCYNIEERIRSILNTIEKHNLYDTEFKTERFLEAVKECYPELLI